MIIAIFPVSKSFFSQATFWCLYLLFGFAGAAQAQTSPESAEQFQALLYGYRPKPVAVQGQLLRQGRLSLTSANYQEHHLELVLPNHSQPKIWRLLILRPLHQSPRGTILFLNKCGNQTLLKDPEITPASGPFLPACQGQAGARGAQANFWRLDLPLKAGWALASLHETEIMPDDAPMYQQNLAKLPPEIFEPGASPGLLAFWSWGLSRSMDYLAKLPNLGPIGLFGHSRRGKTALLTAALDPRFAFVLAHQSGTLGAVSIQAGPLESLESITRHFPHWFTPQLRQFAAHPETFPLRQSELIQLIYPRPVMFSEGWLDLWASPHLAQRTLEEVSQKTFSPLTHYPRSPNTSSSPLAYSAQWAFHEMNANYWQVILAFLADQESEFRAMEANPAHHSKMVR